MSEEPRILKTESCPSLSGLSTLTYHIGCKGDNVYVRLDGNTERGLFSKEWVPLEMIGQLLAGKKPITSLHPLFEGKSVNSAGFMMAVLVNEGLIKIVNEKPRVYERNDLTEFKKGILALMDSDNPPSKTGKGKKTAKKPG